MVLPLYPGTMIRRSKECILRDGSGTLAPKPRQSRFIACGKSGRTTALRRAIL